MNFLELCNELHDEMSDSGPGLTAVTKQVGRYAELVKAIREAWVEVQDDNWDEAFFGKKPKANPSDPDVFYHRHDPQVFMAQLDVPYIPEQYQMVIVYLAMKKLSLSLNAPELRALADEKYSELMARMANRYIGGQWGKPTKLNSYPTPNPLP